VQVDPIKPTLKAPGTKHLKLKYDEPLSKFAFKFNLRRYAEARERLAAWMAHHLSCFDLTWPWKSWIHVATKDAGRGLHSSTVQLNLS